jgi:HK97 family phage prohead protease
MQTARKDPALWNNVPIGHFDGAEDEDADIFIRAEDEPCVCYVRPDGTPCGCSRRGARQTTTGPKAYTVDCSPDDVRHDAGDFFETDEPDVDLATRSLRVHVRATSTQTGEPITDRFRVDGSVPVNVGHESTLVIGTATAERLEITGGNMASCALVMRVKLDASELADLVLHGAAEGIVRGISPEWREPTIGPPKMRGVAIVPIPAHEDSLVARRALPSPRPRPKAKTRPITLDAKDLRIALDGASKVARARSASAPTGSLPRTTQIATAKLGAVDLDRRTVLATASTADMIDGVAIQKWDLERFRRNPVVLWSHDQVGAALPIGVAEEIEIDADKNLLARVRFASAAANPLGEQVLRGIAEGIIRGVSVGFDYDKSSGVATLYEISLVAIPADPNALVGAPSEDDDDARAKRISSAARELAGARKQRAFFGECASCGAQSVNTDEPCPECGHSRRRNVDAKEDEQMNDLIANARKKNAETTRNAWKATSTGEDAPRLDGREDRHVGPLRLDSDRERAKKILGSADDYELHVDAEEEARARAFDERCDELEGRHRADAREREASDDIIEKAKRANAERMTNMWRTGT